MSDIPPLNVQPDCNHHDTDGEVFHTPLGGSPSPSMDELFNVQDLPKCERCGYRKIPKIVIDEAAQTSNREQWLEPEVHREAAPSAQPAVSVAPTAAPTAPPAVSVAPPASPITPTAAHVPPPAAPVAPPIASVAPTAAPVASPAADKKNVKKDDKEEDVKTENKPPAATVAPPAAPVAPPDAPVALPAAPVAPPDAPVALPAAPVAPPVAPVAPPDAPVALPAAPVAPPDAPVAPPDAPVAPPDAPVAPPVASVSPTASPITSPANNRPVAVARGRLLNRSASSADLKRSKQESGDKKSAIGSQEPRRRASSAKPATSKPPPEPVPELNDGPDMPFNDPSEAMSQACTDLASTNWAQHVKALSSFVRLTRHHPKIVAADLQNITPLFAPALKDMRSQVSRAACQASAELFKIKKFEICCDEIVHFLLLRANDTNRFLRDDAKAALSSMISYMSCNKVINLLATKGVTHNHANIKRTASELMLQLLEKKGCDRIYGLSREYRDKVFVIGAILLQEGAADTRKNAKQLMKGLMAHKNFDKVIVSALPFQTYTNITKALKVIRDELKAQ